MHNSNNSSSGGVGITGLLLVLFIGLKLADVISWSWWWVASPIWVPVALIGFVGIAYFLGLLIKDLLKPNKKV